MRYFFSAEKGVPATEKPAADQLPLVMNMSPDFVRALRSAIAHIFFDQTGATATIVAIALPCLIGMSALGIETGVLVRGQITGPVCRRLRRHFCGL